MMAEMILARMTAAEFSALEESNLIRQLIDGELVVTGAPIIKHQRLAYKSAKFIEIQIPDGEVFIAPLNVRFDEYNVFQPDVFWVSAQNTQCIRIKGEFQGAPDLIVEVLSPSTSKNDRGKKFQIYQQAGVREYWLIDPDGGMYVEVWQRVNDQFQRHGIYGSDETFTSAVLAQSIAVQYFLAS